ncbi:MAG: hypothetical protein LUI12_07235 [Clostridiales bacterium]|nr:hypothetical protein [Clostridiales bacterium]
METQIIKSERITLKKNFLIVYAVIILFIVISIVPTIQNYITYQKGQELAIEFCEATDAFSGLKNYNTRQEKAHYLYEKLNQTEFSFNYNGTTVNNGEVVEAYNDVDKALGKVLSGLGYECYYGSRYLEYGSFTSYFSAYINLFTQIMCTLLALTIIANIWYLAQKNTEIIIDGEMVVCKKTKKKIIQFMISDVNSVETTRLKGLLIKGNGIKYQIKLIKNTEDIKNKLLEQKYEHAKGSCGNSTENTEATQAETS